jgi:hypothetical protein
MMDGKKWVVEDLDSAAPSSATMQRFAEGECAGLRFKRFMTHDEISNILAAISKIGMEYYDGDDKAGRTVRKGKLGPNFFRFKDDQREYFRRVSVYEGIFNNQILAPVNFFARVQGAASKVFSRGSYIAEHEGRRMMSCTVRALPEAPVHRDWMPGENTGLSFAPHIIDQFAWNVYLKMPEVGGHTRIYGERNPASVGENTIHSEFVPSIGELVIFRSTQAHAVMPSRGDRLTLSGFFGTTTERLLFWV